MKMYRDYLDKIDFKAFIATCIALANKTQHYLGFEEEPEIILMVHESNSCLCAERPCLVDWFKSNGYELPEYAPLAH